MDKYEILEQVGKGSFGAVTKIRRKADSKLLVWKEICYGRMKEKEKQQLVSEVNILREFRHPYIVKYYDRIVDKANCKIFIVMEFCEKGDLGLLIKKFKRENNFIQEELIWKLFVQILNALHACHNRSAGKILHRDIKPGNILLDSNLNAKLADFGLSRIMGENSVYAETKVGTPYYMSPEQIADLKYNEKSDIWSAGCLLFEMAALHPPFQAKSHAELASKINKGQIEPLPGRYSDDLKRLVNWMMALDPGQRPNVSDILSLPHIVSRVAKPAKDEASRLKDLEKRLLEREEKLRNDENDLRKREEELVKREKKVKELEEKFLKLEERQENLIHLVPVETDVKTDQSKDIDRIYARRPAAEKENLNEKNKDCVPRRVLKAEKVFENLQNDFYPRREEEKARTPNLIPKSPNFPVRESPGERRNENNFKARASPGNPLVRKENERQNPFKRPGEPAFNRYSPEAYDRWVGAKERIGRPQGREARRPQTANVDNRKEEVYRYSPDIGYYQRKEILARRCASAERRYGQVKYSPEVVYAERKQFPLKYAQDNRFL
jgi:NIMA (never in mitosis gene a)-related kinase